MAKNNTTPRVPAEQAARPNAKGVPSGAETVKPTKATAAGKRGPQEQRSARTQSDRARERNATGSSQVAALEQRYSTTDAPGGALAEYYSDLVEAGGEDGGDAIFPRKGSPAPPRSSGPSAIIPENADAAKHRAATLDNTKANAGRPSTADATFSRRSSRPSDPRS